MARLGRVMPVHEIKELISQVDFLNEEFIKYDEIECMMKYDDL